MNLFEPTFPSSWARRSLWDTATWTNGLAFRDFAFTEHGEPVIKIAELKAGVSRQTKRTGQTFDDKYRVRTGDVLYSWSGSPETSLDVFTWSGPEGWLNQHIFKITASRDVDRGFHIQLLRYLRPNLVAIAMNKQTTGLGHITQQDMRRILVGVPSLSEQSAIAYVLGTLDDKLDLNRCICETLEAMARSLFKSWFVDFDPVRAKSEGLIPTGMSPPTTALFSHSFDKSKLGRLPRYWHVQSLDSVANFLNGLALQKFPPGNGDPLPVIKIAEMRSGITAKSDRASSSIPPQYIVQDGDVLFSWSGSLEVVLWTGGRGALNQHLFKVTSDKYPRWFYLYWLKHHLPEFRSIAAGKATTMGHIQRHHLTDAKVVVPPKPIIDHLDKIIEPLVDGMVRNNLESRTLTSLRDTLLPKLLSGELRIKDAEKLASAAL